MLTIFLLVTWSLISTGRAPPVLVQDPVAITPASATIRRGGREGEMLYNVPLGKDAPHLEVVHN